MRAEGTRGAWLASHRPCFPGLAVQDGSACRSPTNRGPCWRVDPSTHHATLPPCCSERCRKTELRLMVLQAADIRLRPQLWAACSEEVAVFCKGVEPGGWGLGVGEGGRVVWANIWRSCPRPCCCC